MRLFKLSEMKDGWFIGDFVPSVLQTPHFEVALKQHKQGEVWDAHYQCTATEYNLLVKGVIEVELVGGGKIVQEGEGFIIEPGEKMRPHFVTNCTVVCVKVPSVIGDKVVIEEVK